MHESSPALFPLNAGVVEIREYHRPSWRRSRDHGLDISEDWCEQCDIVVAAMHSRPSNPSELLLRVFEDSSVDVFAHPSNRLLNERESLSLELDVIMEKAADERIAIEINANPERLDLDWRCIKEYRDTVEFVVSTDATRGANWTLCTLASLRPDVAGVKQTTF